MTDKNGNYIPKIDISSLWETNWESPEVKGTIASIRQACQDVGFITVCGHGVPKDLIAETVAACNKFFNLPAKEKLEVSPQQWNRANSNVYRGYFPSFVNGKEGLDISDPYLHQDMQELLSIPYYEANRFPKNLNPDWENTVALYFSALFSLGRTLMRAIIVSFGGKEELVNQAFKRPNNLSTMRFNFYPRQEKPVEISSMDGVELACETHVDSGFLTILYQDRKGGLQVQNHADGQWHDVPFDPDAFVVNTGLALQTFSGQFLKATNHRVLFNREKRISIPFFVEPAHDFKLNPSLLNLNSPSSPGVQSYGSFLEGSLQKFVEYDRQ
ncbi:MAG: isopenicillin N synthase family oxygenase [SAR324 cluster bacterium]|nr:isopenicillin N synthase family oxygenase [SAR324 cluster bacterium]